MSTDSVVQSTHLFKGDGNYTQWLKRVTIKLKARGLDDSIAKKNPKGAKERDKAIAIDVIINHLDDRVLRALSDADCANPFDLIAKLNAR
ncbi:hypothetical protein U1Q18_051508 [Sarracenia purpurea var. burkii]